MKYFEYLGRYSFRHDLSRKLQETPHFFTSATVVASLNDFCQRKLITYRSEHKEILWSDFSSDEKYVVLIDRERVTQRNLSKVSNVIQEVVRYSNSIIIPTGINIRPISTTLSSEDRIIYYLSKFCVVSVIKLRMVTVSNSISL